MATVDLSWTDNSSNEDGFQIYRTTTSSPSFPGDYTYIDTVGTNTTTYSDSSSPDGDTVYYAVTAYNSAGESNAATTSIETVAAPTLTGSLTSSVSQDDITLDLPTVDWGGDQGSYVIYKGEASGSLAQETTVDSSNSAWTDTALEDGEQFFYAVEAQNSAGTSSLSSEVSEKAYLPSTSDPSPSTSVGSSNIELSWSVNDDSPDGGIDVERSTDGFTSVTTVASNLDDDATLYTDTSTTGGVTYEYRLKRYTDHVTVTSGAVSVRAPKALSRTATVTGDGAVGSSRSLQKTRSAAVSGDGSAAATRTLAKARLATVDGDGRVAASRLLSKQRIAALTADGAVDATRSLVKSRSTSVSGGGAITAIRVLAKDRTTTVTGTGQVDATRVLSKARTAAVTGDGELTTIAEFSEALGERLNGIYIDYDVELAAFVTEWYSDEPVNPRQDLMALRFGSLADTPLQFAIEADVDGDGQPEHRSQWLEFSQGQVPRVYPSVPADAKQYRVLMRGLRKQDVLRRIDTAFVYD